MVKAVGNGKYVVVDHTGKKRLSKPMSREAAHARLRQIEYFKHKNKR